MRWNFRSLITFSDDIISVHHVVHRGASSAVNAASAARAARVLFAKARGRMSNFRDDLILHMPAMRAFARSLCGDATRADDLTQDTVLKALAHCDSFTPGTNMRAWLFTILRNTYFSQLRRRGREVPDPEGRWAATLAVPPVQQAGLHMRDLRRALAELPPAQREAIILVGAGACSYQEAAEICGCAVGTMKSRVSRARRALFEFGIAVDDGTHADDDKAPAGRPTEE